MLPRSVLAAIATVVMPMTTVCLSAQAPADEGARRPFRGLFGAPAAPDSPHSLVLNASIYQAYTVNHLDGQDQTQNATPWLRRSGSYQGARVGLDYSFTKTGERAGFRGHLGGAVNYYHRGSRSRVLPSNQADVSADARLTKSLSIAAHQSGSYTSNYNPSLSTRLGEDFGHDIGLVDDETLDLFELRAVRLTSSVALTQSVGRFLSLSGGYYYRRLDIFDDELAAAGSRFRDYWTQGGFARVGYLRPVSRHAALVLGYRARASDRRSHTGEPSLMHNVDAGVNYSRALSFSRRTTFSFSTGSAIAVNERIDVPGVDPRTRVRLTGNASLVHELGRTWTARAAYSRGFRTRDGFDALYFTDAVHGSLDGLITRRLSFSAAAAWADSSIDTGTAGGHRGTSARAIAQYALTSYAALYTQYVYYRYRFSGNIVLDPRLPGRLERQVVRVGLTTSVPLIR